jgi:hypothetical protein
MNIEQQSTIEAYLRTEFPGGNVRRIWRAGDEEVPAHIRPHADFSGELFEVEGERDYQVGFTDEVLADTLDLAAALTRWGIAHRMRVLEKRHVLFVLTSGFQVVPIDKPHKDA